MSACAGGAPASRRTLCVLSTLLLTGCTTYSPLPLPNHPDLVSTPPSGSAALDMDKVATIAVLNNPDLKAARASARVGAAQAFSAGLLPNPQLSGNRDRPTGDTSGLVTGYGLGLAFDLQALLTQPLRNGAARAM